MTKKLRIISSVSGFRRAGFSFSKEETILKVADLKGEQIEQLKAEPNLVVVEFEDGDADKEVIEISKAAQELMNKNSLTVNEVQGTGKNGNITKGDVEKAIEEIAKIEE